MKGIIKVTERKEKRKLKRQLKKLRNVAFCQRKEIPTLESLKSVQSENAEQLKKRNAVRNKKRKLSRKKKKLKLKQENFAESDEDSESEEEENTNTEFRQQNLEALKNDDKIIKSLEKKLGLSKRKTLPQSFVDDGLNYILDVAGDFKNCPLPLSKPGIDSDSASDKSEDDVDKEQNCDDDDNDDDGGDGDDVNSDDNYDDDDDDEEDDNDDDDEDDNDSESIPELVAAEKTNQASILKRPMNEESSEKSAAKKVKFEDSIQVSKSKQVNLKDGSNATLKEDIYGRLRDADGKIVNSKPTADLHQSLSEVNTIDPTLNKQMKGLINRVNEANMAIMSNQLVELYNCHSRATLNKCLFDNLCCTVIRPEASLDRLLLELALLIVIVHNNIGQEIGAFIIQNLVEKLFQYQKKTEGKELNNIVSLLCCMFNLKIFHSTLMFDLIRLFMESFQEKDVEILSVIFKNCGFGLRKEDPNQLREVISRIQQKSSVVNTEQFEEPGRMRFILDTLLAVKNNNSFKGDHQDRLELLQRFIKLAKQLIQNKSIGDNQLRVSLSDLQNAGTKGRWWIVGSAWSGDTEQTKKEDKVSVSEGNEEVRNFLELSRKQRMNTDIRRNIFCTLMASEDFVDAFERLLRLKLKSTQERDIIHVIVDCCIQEKEYNPYYAHLLQKFCEFHRRFQMTFQFNLWDKLKDMSSLSGTMMLNLAKLVSHLIITKAQSMALFKVLEFGTLDKQTVLFLKTVLLDLFENNSAHVTKMVFERISMQSNLYKFRDGLRLFILHFLIGRKKNKVTHIMKQLQDAVQLLSISHPSTLL